MPPANETVGDWLALVHDRYPPSHAADWDNSGLQVGDPAWPVARVLVSLDVTGAVVEEAATEPDTMVLAHHPLLFRPLTALTPSTASGRTALAAATHRIAVAAAHTNLDVALDGAGTSVPVADALDLIERRPLTAGTREDEQVKLVVFVPTTHTEEVLDALATVGAGRDGAYARCAFRVDGTGTFTPLEGADPYLGTVGQAELVHEHRLELLVPARLLGEAVRTLRAAHPYEEVAYDLVPRLTDAEVGFGIVGTLPAPSTVGAVADRLRERLPAPHLRVAGDPDREVRTVASVGGAGDGLIGAALGAGVDLYVTGDLRHHVTLDALEQGLALIDAGHHATEAAAMPAWVERLRTAASERGLRAPVVASRTPTSPWR